MARIRISCIDGKDCVHVDEIVNYLLQNLLRCKPDGRDFKDYQRGLRLQVVYQNKTGFRFILTFPWSIQDTIYFETPQQLVALGKAVAMETEGIDGMESADFAYLIALRLCQLLAIQSNGRYRIIDHKEVIHFDSKVWVWDLSEISPIGG